LATFFSRHPQNAGLHCNYNAQNTLQHFQGASVLKTFHFFEGTMASPSLLKFGGLQHD